jgi:hypothetical protein
LLWIFDNIKYIRQNQPGQAFVFKFTLSNMAMSQISPLLGLVLANMGNVMAVLMAPNLPSDAAIDVAISAADPSLANFTQGQALGIIAMIKAAWRVIFGRRPAVVPVAGVAGAMPAAANIALGGEETTYLFTVLYELLVPHYNRNLFQLLDLVIATFGHPLDVITNALHALQNSCAGPHGLDFYVANHILLYLIRHCSGANPDMNMSAILAELLPLLQPFIDGMRVSARMLAHTLTDMCNRMALVDINPANNRFHRAFTPDEIIVDIYVYLATLAGLTQGETQLFLVGMNMRVRNIAEFREHLRASSARFSEWKQFLLLLWAPVVVDATLRGSALARQAEFDARVAALAAATVAEVAAGIAIPAINIGMGDDDILALLTPIIGVVRAMAFVAANPRGPVWAFSFYSVPHGAIGIH